MQGKHDNHQCIHRLASAWQDILDALHAFLMGVVHSRHVLGPLVHLWVTHSHCHLHRQRLGIHSHHQFPEYNSGEKQNIQDMSVDGPVFHVQIFSGMWPENGDVQCNIIVIS